MKNIYTCSLFLIAFSFLVPVSAETKVGTVDMLKLARNHASFEQNKMLLEETEKDSKKKLDRFKDDLDEIQEEFKKKSGELRQPMLAEAAKVKIEKELMDVQSRGVALEQQYRSEAMRLQQDLRDLEARLLKSVKADLDKKIAAYAEANGFDLIMDASAVPYAKPALDVTPGVLTAMGVDPAKAVEATDDSDAKKPVHEGK